jgi:hypothetical protein
MPKTYIAILSKCTIIAIDLPTTYLSSFLGFFIPTLPYVELTGFAFSCFLQYSTQLSVMAILYSWVR